MNVNKLIGICFFLVIFVSCNTDEGNIEVEQVRNIESYLKSKQLKYEVIDGVYRAIIDPTPEVEPPVPEEPKAFYNTLSKIKSSSIRSVKEAKVILENGDKAYVYFVMSIFNSQPSGVFLTNVEEIAIKINQDKELISYDPYEVIYGSTPLLTGFVRGLKGAEKGQEYTLFMPYTLAYGDKQQGVVPAKSSICIDMLIVEIVK